MREFDETTNPAGPESRLDHLVNGELNEADRRELILQLEHEPDGWRRLRWPFWRRSAGSRNWE